MKRFLVFLFAVAIVAAWVAPSLAAEASFNGHYRVRAWVLDNISGNSLSSTDDSSSVDHRLRLNIDLKQDDVMGRLQINSGNYTWGESQDSSAWNREMFLVFPLGPTTVKVGRFWAEHPFKGIMFMDVKDALVVTYPVNPDLKLLAIAVNLDDGSSVDANGYRLIANYRPMGSPLGGALGWYYNVVDNSTGAAYIEDRPQWLAGTVDYANGPVNASLTGAYEFGDKDSTTSGAATSKDYSAYALDLRGGYDFAKANGIPLTLEAIFGIGSGDDNANDNDMEEFTAPSPSYTHSDIFLDWGDAAAGGAQLSHGARAQAAGLGNLTWFGLKAAYKATDKVTLKGLLATYYLTEENVTGGTSYRDSELGQEYNVALVYNLAKGLDLLLSSAWFVPQEDGWTTTTDTTTAPNDTVSEYHAKVQWNF